MTKRLKYMKIKIDNVYRVDFLRSLIEYNVDIISIPYKAIKNEFKEEFLSLKYLYNNIEFCIELDNEFVKNEEKILETISKYAPKWIQFNSQTLISLNNIKNIRKKGVNIMGLVNFKTN